MHRNRLSRCLIAATCAATPLPCLSIADAADFYRGKQVTIVVGFTPGGTYDLTARLYARVLGSNLPGKPAVIVQNMPGAGSLPAAANLYNVAPKDGTTLGVVGGGIVVEALLGNPQARYDPRRLAWIGGRTRDNFLCLALGSTGVTSIDDVKLRELVVGSTGPGSRTMTFPRALNELVGTRFKIVSGYPGGNEITMAMERGEVEGYCGWSLDSITSRAPDWLPSGKITALAQFTLARSAALPNVPFADDLAPSTAGRQALRMLASDSTLAWPFVAPPDLPTERVAELRAAFDAASKDPELLAEARKAKLEVDPVTGRELQALVDQLSATPKEVIGLVRKISAR
jgi:tripartite-type tricarboxylate transporter receptor subunit TctC